MIHKALPLMESRIICHTTSAQNALVPTLSASISQRVRMRGEQQIAAPTAPSTRSCDITLVATASPLGGVRYGLPTYFDQEA